MNKKKITTEGLLRVGYEVAIGWGAALLGYKVIEGNRVQFNCVEYGDYFYTILTFNDIYKKYYDLL